MPLTTTVSCWACITLRCASPASPNREDILELLQTIGSHLRNGGRKATPDLEARRLSIMEERTSLAHELARFTGATLASLRFQVRLLEDLLPRKVAATR